MTLLELLQIIKKHLKLCIALPIIFALVTAVFSYVALANTYGKRVHVCVSKFFGIAVGHYAFY